MRALLVATRALCDDSGPWWWRSMFANVRQGRCDRDDSRRGSRAANFWCRDPAASTSDMISSWASQFIHHFRRMGSTAASSQDPSKDTCVICLSAVTERAITSPCSHYSFDFVCLVSWLQERSTCPLCKLNLMQAIAKSCSFETR